MATGVEKKAPTLLELSRAHRRPTPPLKVESSDSDSDQPPVARDRSETTSLASARGKKTMPVASQLDKRTSRGEELNLPPSDQLNSSSLLPSSSKETRRQSKALEGKSDLDNEHHAMPRHRNHYIKSIRRGIPDIVATNSKGRSKQLVAAEIEITPYCVCNRDAEGRLSNWKAWSFSLLTVCLCIICPLISFSADVAFFASCRSNYNRTETLLSQVYQVYGTPAPPNVVAVDTSHHEEEGHERHRPTGTRHNRHRFAHRLGRDTESLLELDQDRFILNRRRRQVKHTIRHKKRNRTVTNLEIVTSFRSLLNQSASAVTTEADAATEYNSDAVSTNADGSCSAHLLSNKCAGKPELLTHMRSFNASENLRTFKHVITNVFEPVVIILSFPSFLLCIFTRLVIMLTSHDHFLSAYVMNIVTMPLPLVTGALSFHASSYYTGPTGFECWKCALSENCSDTEASSWLEPNIRASLSFVTATKFVDGIAGGCVLTLVLCRIIWSDRGLGHASCWRYLIRLILSKVSFLFCVTTSTVMMLTPSFSVFQYEILKKLNYFNTKDSLCFAAEVILALGITAWAASTLVITIYLSYRTFVYCRRKEHLSKDVLL